MCKYTESDYRSFDDYSITLGDEQQETTQTGQIRMIEWSCENAEPWACALDSGTVDSTCTCSPKHTNKYTQ